MKPYLKWAGGKSRSMRHILQAMPQRMPEFYDLTCGGLSVYLALYDAGRIQGPAHLYDAMPSLIYLHNIARTRPDLIEGTLNWPWDKESFYRIREVRGDRMFEALKMFYANRRGYNGLIRHNKSGQLRTTWGGGPEIQKIPKDLHTRLDDCKRALTGVDLRCVSMFDVTPTPGSVVYVDPPYPETSPTATFCQYSSDFGPEQHRELASRARIWSRKCLVLISNADIPFIREIYSGCYFKEIVAPRTIGVPRTSIGHAQELLIQVVP